MTETVHSRAERLEKQAEQALRDYIERGGTHLREKLEDKTKEARWARVTSEIARAIEEGKKTLKVRRLSEFLGQSYFDYLAGLDDLVLIMDEAHRGGVRFLRILGDRSVVSRSQKWGV